MNTQVERCDRVFQLWSYSVSMGRLLLRSTKSDQFQSRVDVVFQNVKAIQLPTMLPGLVVAEAGLADTERIVVETGLLPDDEQRVFLVAGSNFTGYVVAGIVLSCEDSGEYYEPSEVWKDGPGNLG